MYSKTEEAIHFVFKAFEGQRRIKEDIPLAFHSVTVGYMLRDLGCSEEIVLTGLLHDILEDTKYNYDYLEENYGEKVANNVLRLSENKTIKNWVDRKQEFLTRMENENADLVLVELADKLHNLLSDYPLYKKIGNKALVSLNATREEHKWFYTELLKIFKKKLDITDLLNKFEEIVNIYYE